MRYGDRFQPFEAVLDQVQECIYIVGTDYRYRYANQRVIEFEGWNAGQVVGRHVIELVGPLIFKRLVKPRLERCFRGERVNFQHWVTNRSGQRQYIDVVLAPFREWDDNVVGAVVTIRDKTLEKKLEDSLKDQANLYRQLVMNSVVGIAILQDSNLVFANQVFASVFGYEIVDEMFAQVDSLSFAADYDRERVRSLEQAFTEGLVGPSEYLFDGIGKNGNIIPLLASSNSIFWQGQRARQLITVDLAKQQSAEHALAATAASFQEVVEGSLQGFFVTQNGHFVHVNRAYVDLLGYSEEELKASPVVSFYAPHERQRLIDYRLRRLEKNVAPEVYEVDALHKDGRLVRLQQCVRLVDSWFDEEAILGFAIDVTSKHLAKTALQDEHNLLRAIIDNIPAVVFAKDRDGQFLIKNKAGAAFVGETNPTNMVGKTNGDYYPADLVKTFRANELVVMETGEPLVDDENDVVSPVTGELIPMSGCVTPLRNADDEVIGIVGVSHDITRHRQSEAALRESEQRFKDIAQVSSDWFWEMDADLRFTYIFGSCARTSGHGYPDDPWKEAL